MTHVLVQDGKAIDYQNMTKDEAQLRNEQFKLDKIDKKYEPCKVVKSIRNYVEDM